MQSNAGMLLGVVAGALVFALAGADTSSSLPDACDDFGWNETEQYPYR